MELREFAENVLFATSLEDKLRPPVGELTDREGGGGIVTPPNPGRPDRLVISAEGTDTKVPSALNSDADRGVLLHFLANHELLATELMALVLLKFPDAPPAFRRGVLRTLKEEQEHTRLYMRRMQECGVHFGDFPVSGYFWNVVSSMETPLDYVSRLSLTFEQANLDFSRYYGKVFEDAGDVETAQVLETIYRDEIAHVGLGAKWFRRWGGDLDFDTFAAQLPAPLSPARAKADHLIFNGAGRIEAGLNEEFVERLRLFRRSRGRTPNIYFYNPSAEEAAAHEMCSKGTAFLPSKVLRKSAADLETVMGVLAGRDDVVIVSRPPSAAFLNAWISCGFTPPEFSTRETLFEGSNRRLNQLKPWAWEPEAFALLHAGGDRWAHNAEHPDGWSQGFASLYAKGSWPSEQGHLCRDEAAVSDTVQRLRAEGEARLVLKGRFGLAGRDFVHLMEGEELPPSRVRKLLQAHGGIVVDVWRERLLDFSAQYELRAGRLKFLGLCCVENDDFGRFRGIAVGNTWRKKLPASVQRWLGENRVFERYREQIPRRLTERLNARGVVGGLGVDAFVYRHPEGGLQLREVCEVNPRITMGRLALACAKKTGWQDGALQLVTKRDLGEGESFASWSEGQGGREGNRLLPLNDPATATVCLLVYHTRC